MGTLTVSSGGVSRLVALNCVPSAKIRLLAVLVMKEPLTFNLAFGPNIIPLGLIRKRLADPLVWSKPFILEIEPPVTRLMMLLTFGSLAKKAGEGSGAIQLRGNKIVIDEESKVTGRTEGGNAGQPLTIKASDFVDVNKSQVGTITEKAGSAGDIAIATRRLIVRNGGLLGASTSGSGQGGNLTVDASESVEVLGDGFFTELATRSLGVNPNTGNAGTVQITTKNLILRDGGRISTSTNTTGNGGTLRVDASESVEASGRAVLDINLPSGLFAESRKLGSIAAIGNGGDLIINTQRLLVQDGASISTAAINGSTGQAGRLDINASNSLTVTGTGIGDNGQIVPSTLLAASEGSGSAGDLRINTNKLTVRDRAQVSVASTGSGRAGNLEITSDVLLLDNQGKLTAATTAGEGNINLRSLNLLILRRGSVITTSATGN